MYKRQHLDLLDAPLQLHHAVDDDVVNIGYAADLAVALELSLIHISEPTRPY